MRSGRPRCPGTLEVGTGTVLLPGHRLTPRCHPAVSARLPRKPEVGTRLHQHQTSHKNTEPGNRARKGTGPRPATTASQVAPGVRSLPADTGGGKAATIAEHPQLGSPGAGGAGTPSPTAGVRPGQATASHSPAPPQGEEQSQISERPLKGLREPAGLQGHGLRQKGVPGRQLRAAAPKAEWRPPGAWGAGGGTRGLGCAGTGAGLQPGVRVTLKHTGSSVSSEQELPFLAHLGEAGVCWLRSVTSSKSGTHCSHTRVCHSGKSRKGRDQRRTEGHPQSYESEHTLVLWLQNILQR